MLDVKKLISVLKKLAEKGNTVLVIEHNFEVLLQSDYVLEVGPGAGDSGGEILFQGACRDFVLSEHRSPTKDHLGRLVCEDVEVLARQAGSK